MLSYDIPYSPRYGGVVKLLERRQVPYVSNLASLALDARIALVDDRHPSAVGHQRIAQGVARLLLDESGCAGSADRGAGVARGAMAPTSCLARVPLPAASASAAHVASGQTCQLGVSLNASVQRSAGFRYVQPLDHRTPGLVAEQSGAECVLRFASSSLRAGFLSLTLERGHRNLGAAEITCLPPCACLPSRFDAHAAQRYTFSQRSAPRWAVLGPGGVCDVRVLVLDVTAGRLMIHALTYSAALPGNVSVDTNSLYALLGPGSRDT